MAVQKEIPVKVRSLDSLLASRELPEELLPDFISLDTQGTEFQVLQGALNTIKQSVLAIVSEVEFTPMYDGQNLFGEIFDFMRGHNFQLGGFQYLQDILPCHLSVGLRSQGFLGFGDAIFFRDLEGIRQQFGNGLEFAIAGAKMALIAFSFGYSSFAIAAARAAMAAEIGEAGRALLKRRTYFRFAEEVDAAAREMPERYLHTSRLQLVAERRVVIAQREAAIAQRQAAIAQRRAAVVAQVRSLLEDAKTVTDRECSAARTAAEKVAEARRFVGSLRIYQVNELALLRQVAQQAMAQAASAVRSAATVREEAHKVGKAFALLDTANAPDAAEPLGAMAQEVEQAASTAAGFADAAQNSAEELIRQPIVRVFRAVRAPLRVASLWRTTQSEARGTSCSNSTADNASTEVLISAENLLGVSAEEAVADDKRSEPSTLAGSDEVNGASPVEAVLARYGFETASAELRRRRCTASRYIRRSE
jgi:hypothetical protein